MRKNILHFVNMAIAFSICLITGACKNESSWKPGMPLPKEEIKIALIFLNGINRNSVYDNAHYEGVLEMQRNIGLADDQIIYKVNIFDGDPGVTEGVIRDCLAEGVNIVIATSSGYMGVCEKLAAEFQNVIFIQTMGHRRNNHNFTFYTTRLYQARYLSGIAAGMQTKTGKVGFVAALGKENSEVTGGINAFAIGVEDANPEARVLVDITYSWYDPMGETDAANALIAAGCDVIATHSDTVMAQLAAQKAGVWAIGFNNDMSSAAQDAVITSVVPRWGICYTGLIESIINGTFNAAPNFYGLKEGAVDITPLNEKIIAPETKAAVEAGRQRIMDGFNVFDGILETNDGRTVGDAGKTLTDEVILSGINWYYKTVF